MVPDHGGRVEPERPAAFLKLPAHVHVVAGDAELRIEPADRFEARFAERHVAAWDVLRLAVGKEHVHGTARRIGDALCDRPVIRWRDIRSAHACMVRGAEG